MQAPVIVAVQDTRPQMERLLCGIDVLRQGINEEHHQSATFFFEDFDFSFTCAI